MMGIIMEAPDDFFGLECDLFTENRQLPMRISWELPGIILPEPLFCYQLG